jgi:pyruvate dehydrogenase E2 component (dihydrolipoamide acetyltransferase)
VAVIELLVKVGDTVKAEQSLITVESDKASMEIPSSTAGVVKELRSSWATRSSKARWCWWWKPRVTRPPRPSAGRHRARLLPRPCAGPVAAPHRCFGSSGPVEVRVPDIGDFKDVASSRCSSSPATPSRWSRA